MALEEARPRGSLVVEGEGAESRLTNQVLKMPSPPSNPTLLLLLRPPVSVVVSSLEVSQVPLNKTRHNESLGGGNIRQSLIPPYGTWGLGSLRPASVDCLNFDGLSAPPGVSVFEAYKLSDASKEHGSTMTVRTQHPSKPTRLLIQRQDESGASLRLTDRPAPLVEGDLAVCGPRRFLAGLATKRWKDPLLSRCDAVRADGLPSPSEAKLLPPPLRLLASGLFQICSAACPARALKWQRPPHREQRSS